MKAAKLLKLSGSLSLPLIIVACGGDDNSCRDRGPSAPATPVPTTAPTMPPMTLTEFNFDIEIVNTTSGQPLAPAGVILHGADYRAWQVGQPASAGLETLAESGNPEDFIAEAQSAYETATLGSAPLPPGDGESMQLSAMLDADAASTLQLSIAAMPVNTNDAFTGASGIDLGELDVGESYRQLLPIYDAGTELNTETAATVPGPAGGGAGFDPQRDDIADQVTRHPGVVTSADGNPDSTLDSTHKFDQGAMLITITRR